MSAAVSTNAAFRGEMRLEYVQTPRGALYTWTARPANPRACVLVCSSLFGDFSSNYHRERELGRTLASHGLGVMRFHYAGEGNSWGERRDASFTSLCEDARAVLNYGADLGFSKFAVLGTRMGTLIAAATVATIPLVPLALWDPVVDPFRFIADGQRARRISRTAQGLASESADWREDIRKSGVLDLLGHDVYPSLIDSLEGIDLLGVLGQPPRELFLAQFGGAGGYMQRLSDDLLARGFSVDSANFGITESWWFHSEIAPQVGDLVSATTGWFMKLLTGST